jgi:hypothetical protein
VGRLNRNPSRYKGLYCDWELLTVIGIKLHRPLEGMVVKVIGEFEVQRTEGGELQATNRQYRNASILFDSMINP